MYTESLQPPTVIHGSFTEIAPCMHEGVQAHSCGMLLTTAKNFIVPFWCDVVTSNWQSCTRKKSSDMNSCVVVQLLISVWECKQGLADLLMCCVTVWSPYMGKVWSCCPSAAFTRANWTQLVGAVSWVVNHEIRDSITFTCVSWGSFGQDQNNPWCRYTWQPWDLWWGSLSLMTSTRG